MKPEPNQRQLDALEKYLRGELDVNHPDLPSEEAALARQLRAVSTRSMQPAPQFVKRRTVVPSKMTASDDAVGTLSTCKPATLQPLPNSLVRWLAISTCTGIRVSLISFGHQLRTTAVNW